MKTKNVIIDCDPGIDDALALMLACRSPQLNILGVTIVSGNTRGEQCAKNAVQILKLMDREDIPVYLGETTPLKQALKTAEDTHADDGLGGMADQKGGFKYHLNAIDFILKTLQSDIPIDIIAIGPLSNIARCLKQDAKNLRRLQTLTVMGGAFRSHGNCSPVAEFNFWADPDAAELVFKNLNRPITMVGLDVTRQVVMTPNYTQLIHYFGGPIAECIEGMIAFYTDFHWKQEKTLGIVVNDPLALAYYLNPELCGGEDYYVSIVTEGKATGMSMVDVQGIEGRAPNAHVLTEVDAAGFFKYFLGQLFPEQRQTICEIIDNPKY
ncbi:MAG: nucleoside hydrolase [Eubacterium aggregans]|uniref:nucleoside hydrolase n=1 Tax=Eubacterium aggregans TaxID=81409 RepID=UPI002B1FEEC6|nr:nucleoside hydrolase [Eubacterium aggregans]MEA5074368.1 nucleoside hydrolase [Eubacterium aggregans]